jgi:hypothetical protein
LTKFYFGKKIVAIVHCRRFQSLVNIVLALIVFTLTIPMLFVTASFLPEVSEVKERG